MASRFVFLPEAASFPSSAFAEFTLINTSERIYVLAFDAGATNESCFWQAIAPQGLTGAITIIITYVMASATSGNVILQGTLEAVTDGDSLDLDSATSYDTANSSSATAVPGTAGHIDQISITMTNADSIAAGDWFRLRVTRDSNSASDTAAGDLYLLAVEFRDAA